MKLLEVPDCLARHAVDEAIGGFNMEAAKSNLRTGVIERRHTERGYDRRRIVSTLERDALLQRGE